MFYFSKKNLKLIFFVCCLLYENVTSWYIFFKSYSLFFILNFLFILYINHSFPSLSSSWSPTSYPLLRKCKAPHGESTTPGMSSWRRTKSLPTASRLSKASTIGNGLHSHSTIGKSQLRHQGWILIPLPGAPQTNQVTQLSPICRGPSWIPCRHWSRVCECPWTRVSYLWPPT